MHRLGLISYLLFILGTASCQTRNYDEMLNSLYGHTVPVIKSSDLSTMMSKSRKPIILDTRSPEEFAVSHLEGARFIDYDHFDKKEVESLPKSMPVVVYCSVGYRSEKIGEELQKIGFRDVKNLYGGIFQWKNEGFQVVNKNEAPTDSIHAYNKTWAVWLKSGTKVF